MRVDETIEGFASASITLNDGEGRAESELRKLTIGDKTLFVLKQRGHYPAMAYDHARLLAPQVKDGAFPEIMATIARSVDLDNPRFQGIASALYRGYTKRVLDHVSDEFGEAIEEFAKGLAASFSSPPFSDDDVRHALVAIEVGNLAEGLMRRIEIPFVRAKAIIGAGVVAAPFLGRDDTDTFVREVETDSGIQEGLVAAIRQITNVDNRVSSACTGMSIPAGLARDGLHLHGRILDADLYHWNTAPVLFLTDETPSNPAFHKYAAFGTAGLIYPGGISGLNDAGIGVSLHQLSTTEYDSTPTTGRADIAPFVQQRILREAGNLDEAVRIVRDTSHFAAWVFFISDAKTGEAVRVEVNGDHEHASEKRDSVVAQTNHFLEFDPGEAAFDASDPHFTPTFGKYLETRARYLTTKSALERSLAGRDADTDWAIDQFADSHDWWLAETLQKQGHAADDTACDRAYGRAIRRVYGQLTSIVRADPGRAPGRDELWLSIGDRLPSAHSMFAGFHIDWDTMALTPVSDAPVRRAGQYQRTGRENWASSTERYLWARTTLVRPRDDSGALLRRNLTDQEQQDALERAVTQLTSAIQLAGRDHIVEVPYHYMRARIRHRQGAFSEALEDWYLLLDIWGQQTGSPPSGAAWPTADAPRYMPRLIEYEAGLVHLLSTAPEDCIIGHLDWDGRARRLDEAKRLLEDVKSRFFGDRAAHFDLEAWIDLIQTLKDDGGAAVDLPDPNFITVE